MSIAGAAAGWLIRRLPSAPRPVILMYHRIADRRRDPWGLCVRPERFADQLRALRHARSSMSLADFAEGCASRTICGNAVAVTFDDGYADNAHVACPMLEAAGIAATMFVTSDAVMNGEPFWWDLLAHIVFAPPALRGTLDIRGEAMQIDLPAMRFGDEPPRDWRAPSPTRSARARLYVALWQALKDLLPGERAAVLTQLGRWRAVPAIGSDDLPMSREDLASLGSSLIEVAAHGRTHQPLTSCDAAIQRDEIAHSRLTIAKLSGRSSASFAYPHGDADAAVCRVAHEAGVLRACTTRAAAVDVACFQRLAMPRMAVGDWTGAELLRRMRALRT